MCSKRQHVYLCVQFAPTSDGTNSVTEFWAFTSEESFFLYDPVTFKSVLTLYLCADGWFQF